MSECWAIPATFLSPCCRPVLLPRSFPLLCPALLSLPQTSSHLEVYSQRTVRKGVDVHLQDLQADVVVIQLAVTQRDVHVQRHVLAVLEKQALVDVCAFLRAG